MNTITTVFTFLMLIGIFSLQAQSEKVAGDYYFRDHNGSHIVWYKLTLKPDGTYVFHSYAKLWAGVTEYMHNSGNGRWGVKGNTVLFDAEEEEDFNGQMTVYLNNAKARVVSSVLSDTPDTKKTKLQFYKSRVPWIEGMEFLKI